LADSDVCNGIDPVEIPPMRGYGVVASRTEVNRKDYNKIQNKNVGLALGLIGIHWGHYPR
jgi:hypothetical protein